MSTYLPSLIHAYERLAAAISLEEAAAKAAKGQYEYIPLSEESFIEQVKQARFLLRGETPRFIDVGCGVGSKMFLAQQILQSNDCYGIEITPDYAAAARRLLNECDKMHFYARRPNEACLPDRIIEGDAIKMSYEKFNIIYFYCPLRDPLLERVLERRIAATCKPGTIILANYYQSKALFSDTKRFVHYTNTIYQRRAKRRTLRRPSC